MDLNVEHSGELDLVIHSSRYLAAVNSDKLAISEELEPATQAELSFLWVGVVHKLRKIHMRGEWQQAVIHCLAAVFLRLDDVFLIVTAAR